MWKQKNPGHPALKNPWNSNWNRLAKYYSDDQEKGEFIFRESKILGFFGQAKQRLQMSVIKSKKEAPTGERNP